MGTASISSMLLAQARSEFVTRWRIPAFSITSLVLPILFFTFFGLPFARQTSPAGVSVGAYLLVSFAAYGVGNVMVYGFGIGVAVERGQKVDVLMRAMPIPPLVVITAKVLNALVFSLISIVALIAYGVVVGGVHQDLGVWVSVIGRLLAGSLPFVGLGFAIGYGASPNAAPALANLIYLPLSFASGLFMPVNQLPGFVQRVAPYLPSYHYGQLAWGAVGAPAEPLHVSLAWLAGYTAVFMFLALRAYRREESRKFA
jgi:ABC-type multidrug transport system, permease component